MSSTNIIRPFGCRVEDELTEEPAAYLGSVYVAPGDDPAPLTVGAQLPEPWRTHPLAEAWNQAEVALVLALVEEKRAGDHHLKCQTTLYQAEQLAGAAEEAMIAARAAAAQSVADVDRAREALTRAMAEEGQ